MFLCITPACGKAGALRDARKALALCPRGKVREFQETKSVCYSSFDVMSKGCASVDNVTEGGMLSAGEGEEI